MFKHLIIQSLTITIKEVIYDENLKMYYNHNTFIDNI